MLLLSPAFSSGLRSPYNFVQLRNIARISGQKNVAQRRIQRFASPLETLDPSFEDEEEAFVSKYQRGMQIKFSVLRFGPMGASVS